MKEIPFNNLPHVMQRQKQRIAELEAQVAQYVKRFAHYHINNGENDGCLYCGLDQSDPIHYCEQWEQSKAKEAE